MTESTFDTLARGADSRQGRRHALKAFGAAALAAVVGAPMAAEAKKNGKNKKRKKNRGVDEQECPICPPEDCAQEAEQAATERCQTQIGPCEDLVRANCADNDDCLDAQLPCCEVLGACDTAGFFTCLANANS